MKETSEGLVYRQYKPVYYSPSSRSALAEAELVYQDNHVSHSAYVCFELDTQGTLGTAVERLIEHYEQVRLLVWTTTPWTLSANMVCGTDTVLGVAHVCSGRCGQPGHDVQFRQIGESAWPNHRGRGEVGRTG